MSPPFALHSIVSLIIFIACSTPVIAAASNVTSNASESQYKGVSIGGWLVLEPYITPSLFNQTLNYNETWEDLPVDEYHFCEKLGEQEARKRLDEHWSTFYNETDFQQIKDHGLNMVRIPIGYWSFEKLKDDPYVAGAQEYLDKALEWCSNWGLKVMIDLHGAPNTQNGFDNSGLRNIGYPGWQNKTQYVSHTVDVLAQIYAKYGQRNYSDVVIGIEILNEPYGPGLDMNKVEKFYLDAYNDARDIQEVNNTIFFHDAFQNIQYWDDFFDKGKIKYTNTSSNRTVTESADFYNLIVDHHHYEVFAPSVADNLSQHLQNIKNYADAISNETHYAIVGEWSAALTDCAPWLNGIGLGSRYEATPPYDSEDGGGFKRVGSCSVVNKPLSKWSKTQKRDYRRFIEMQMYQYDKRMNGWIFWCWKTEGGAIEWDFRQLAAAGIVPQPLDDYKYIKNGVDTSSALALPPPSYRLMTAAVFILGSLTL
ncbi:uncharacterized protein LODBEIA_P28180 [Lodderomyces beijingensis]|uniref:glucan 1,3-beta-glucosidase n=1 Tax=Lodderomyces beijingensis TaxID=1775926 RepID=A0ABP0ZKC3_9ASCO